MKIGIKIQPEEGRLGKNVFAVQNAMSRVDSSLYEWQQLSMNYDVLNLNLRCIFDLIKLVRARVIFTDNRVNMNMRFKFK